MIMFLKGRYRDSLYVAYENSRVFIVRIDLGTGNTASRTKGLPGVLRNKGTLAKYRREQGIMNPFLGSRGTKPHKLEDENNVSKFIKRRPNTEKVWEHGNIGQFWKGQGNKDPPGRPSEHDHLGLSQVPSCPQTPFGTLNFLFLVALAACGKFVSLEPQLLVNSWEAIYYKGGT